VTEACLCGRGRGTREGEREAPVIGAAGRRQGAAELPAVSRALDLAALEGHQGCPVLGC